MTFSVLPTDLKLAQISYSAPKTWFTAEHTNNDFGGKKGVDSISHWADFGQLTLFYTYFGRNTSNFPETGIQLWVCYKKGKTPLYTNISTVF